MSSSSVPEFLYHSLACHIIIFLFIYNSISPSIRSTKANHGQNGLFHNDSTFRSRYLPIFRYTFLMGLHQGLPRTSRTSFFHSELVLIEKR